MLRVDNTQRSTAHECLRKYYYNHIRRLKTSKGSTALRYGSVWHEALDTYYSYIAHNGWRREGKELQAAIMIAKDSWDEESSRFTFFEDYRTLPNLITSLLRYHEFFLGDEMTLKVVQSERPFEIEMVPTDDEAFSYDWQSFIFTGIIDLEITLANRLWIIDHKTTGQPLSIQAERLDRAMQFLGYTYAAQFVNPTNSPDGFLIQLHHLSARKSSSTGNYGTAKIDFQRIPQIYNQGDLASWRESMFSQVQRIEHAINTNCFPKEYDSCYTFGRCGYYQLCSQNLPLGEELTGDYIQVEPWVVKDQHEKKLERRKKIIGDTLEIK